MPHSLNLEAHSPNLQALDQWDWSLTHPLSRVTNVLLSGSVSGSNRAALELTPPHRRYQLGRAAECYWNRWSGLHSNTLQGVTQSCFHLESHPVCWCVVQGEKSCCYALGVMMHDMNLLNFQYSWWKRQIPIFSCWKLPRFFGVPVSISINVKRKSFCRL